MPWGDFYTDAVPQSDGAGGFCRVGPITHDPKLNHHGETRG
jgi:hypothetical protein